jgi:hypothetical protein
MHNHNCKASSVPPLHIGIAPNQSLKTKFLGGDLLRSGAGPTSPGPLWNYLCGVERLAFMEEEERLIPGAPPECVHDCITVNLLFRACTHNLRDDIDGTVSLRSNVPCEAAISSPEAPDAYCGAKQRAHACTA